jgi:hypothetical protein
MYFPKIVVKRPQMLRGLRPGQWIEYEGATGRYMGRVGCTVWIAWGSTATKRFAQFAAAFRAQRDRPPFRPNWDRMSDGGIHRIV